MSRYPSESVERMDQQWAETEDERNARLRRKRLERVAAGLCYDCPPEGYPTDKTRCEKCPRRTASNGS